MRFFTRQHQFYCRIDLHADAMYGCILHAADKVVVWKIIHPWWKVLLRLIRPYRNGLVVGCRGLFRWD